MPIRSLSPGNTYETSADPFLKIGLFGKLFSRTGPLRQIAGASDEPEHTQVGMLWAQIRRLLLRDRASAHLLAGDAPRSNVIEMLHGGIRTTGPTEMENQGGYRRESNTRPMFLPYARAFGY